MAGKIRTVTLFPGQGSQYPGMPKEVLENFPWTQEIFEEASDALKMNLTKLCLEGPESDLRLTENAQPAILTTSYAWFEVLRRQLSYEPSAVAGHSLGEYSALLGSGAFDLGTAVKLVRKRGQLMQSAVPVGEGKMAAFIGLADEIVRAICEEASDSDHQVVAANYNAPSQVVIAGHSAAVERAQVLASGETRKEFKARKVVPLNVSAPFHSPLMKPVADSFEADLKSAKWSELRYPIVSNLDAELRQEGDWVTLLRDQIDHPVLWTQSIEGLAKQEFETYVEVGPGKVLTGLVKRIARGSQLFNVDSLEELKKFETFLNAN